MQELRLVAVSEDGSYAVLAVPGRSGRFLLPIDDRLRTVARGQFSRLAQYEIEVEYPLRPKEIQDRIRAGETADEIAEAAGIPPDRIRRFEGPVLAEREYRALEAQRATVKGHGDGPGPRLGDIVAERLASAGATTDSTRWDSRKRNDGNWQIQLQFAIAGRLLIAEWVFDPRRRHVTPDDDQAVQLCLPESDWPTARFAARAHGTATVTPIGSRLGLHQHDADRRTGSARQGGLGAAPQRAAQDDLPAHAGDRAGGGATAAAVAESRAAADAGHDSATLIMDTLAGQQAADGAGQAEETAAPDQLELPAPPAAPAKKAAGGRSRRSSVPSWDEIMFGTSRQQD
jgi:Protein of unknown function (DUF3071)